MHQCLQEQKEVPAKEAKRPWLEGEECCTIGPKGNVVKVNLD